MKANCVFVGFLKRHLSRWKVLAGRTKTHIELGRAFGLIGLPVPAVIKPFDFAAEFIVYQRS